MTVLSHCITWTGRRIAFYLFLMVVAAPPVAAAPGAAQTQQGQSSSTQIPPASVSQASLAEWRGTYVAEADAGRTRGGSAISVSLTLAVSPPDRPNQAVLSLEGFQTDDLLICDLDPANGELGLLFRSYEDGAVTNRFGIAPYQVGQRLLTLRRIAGQPRPLSTLWQALKPPGKPQAVQFRRKKG